MTNHVIGREQFLSGNTSSPNLSHHAQKNCVFANRLRTNAIPAIWFNKPLLGYIDPIGRINLSTHVIAAE
jgi:hypothetical protein